MPPGSASESAATAERSPGAFRRIELLPNCSLTVPGACIFFAAVAFGSLGVALPLVVQGFWPILPFAGLELALLAWALWASMRRRHWTQTIVVSDQEVEITTRGPEGERTIVFSRHWASVKLRGPHGWRPSRLLIESHGRECEVGAFLTEDGRRSLWRRLGALIGRSSESPPIDTVRATSAREASGRQDDPRG